MRDANKHVIANITALAEALELLPDLGDDEKMVSTKEAVRRLLPAIVGLHRKGYAPERIAEKLAERGLTVSGGTLRRYLRGAKKKRNSVPARTAVAPAGEPPRTTREGSAAGAKREAPPAGWAQAAGGAAPSSEKRVTPALQIEDGSKSVAAQRPDGPAAAPTGIRRPTS